MFLLDEEPTLSNIMDTIDHINLLLPRILNSYTITRVKEMVFKIPKIWYNHDKKHGPHSTRPRLIIGASCRIEEDPTLYPEIIMGLMDVFRFVNSFVDLD